MGLRSSNIKLLEKAKDTTLRIDIYSSKLGILKSNGRISSSFMMEKYQNKDLYLTTPSIKDLGLKEINAGSQLLGYLKLNKDSKECLRPKFRNNGQKGSASLCVPIICNILNPSKSAESRKKLPAIKDDKKEESEDKEDDDKKLSIEEMQRDAMIDWIKKKIKEKDQQKKHLINLERNY